MGYRNPISQSPIHTVGCDVNLSCAEELAKSSKSFHILKYDYAHNHPKYVTNEMQQSSVSSFKLRKKARTVNAACTKIHNGHRCFSDHSSHMHRSLVSNKYYIWLWIKYITHQGLLLLRHFITVVTKVFTTQTSTETRRWKYRHTFNKYIKIYDDTKWSKFILSNCITIDCLITANHLPIVGSKSLDFSQWVQSMQNIERCSTALNTVLSHNINGQFVHHATDMLMHPRIKIAHHQESTVSALRLFKAMCVE